LIPDDNAYIEAKPAAHNPEKTETAFFHHPQEMSFNHTLNRSPSGNDDDHKEDGGQIIYSYRESHKDLHEGEEVSLRKSREEIKPRPLEHSNFTHVFNKENSCSKGRPES